MLLFYDSKDAFSSRTTRIPLKTTATTTATTPKMCRNSLYYRWCFFAGHTYPDLEEYRYVSRNQLKNKETKASPRLFGQQLKVEVIAHTYVYSVIRWRVGFGDLRGIPAKAARFEYEAIHEGKSVLATVLVFAIFFHSAK